MTGLRITRRTWAAAGHVGALASLALTCRMLGLLPSPLWGGVGGGGRSRGTTICPHGVSRESGPSAIAQSRHGNVNSPARCGPRRRKRSGNSGGTCATGFPPEAHISVAKFELAATSSTLLVTRGALLSRSMVVSTERDRPL